MIITYINYVQCSPVPFIKDVSLKLKPVTFQTGMPMMT